jgi:hypothetical protein
MEALVLQHVSSEKGNVIVSIILLQAMFSEAPAANVSRSEHCLLLLP